MLALNLPTFEVKMKDDGTKKMIFDVIRRKYVALTPEEWVRQHFVHYLIEQLGYPQELLANEVEVTLNGTSKRCDTVLYDRNLKARMIVEYKAADIPITQKVFNQIMRYTTKDYVFLSEIPNYNFLSSQGSSIEASQG